MGDEKREKQSVRKQNNVIRKMCNKGTRKKNGREGKDGEQKEEERKKEKELNEKGFKR